MITRNFSITTDRLLLKIPEISDIPLIFKATRVPGFNGGMVWNPPEDQASMMPYFQETLQKWDKQIQFCFSIYNIKNKELIGRIDVRKVAESLWNLGYFTLPEHQGNGFMTKAVEALLEFSFKTLQLNELEAGFALWNTASQKVMSNNRMTYKCDRKEGFKKNGQWVAEKVYSITREQWLKDKS